MKINLTIFLEISIYSKSYWRRQLRTERTGCKVARRARTTVIPNEANGACGTDKSFMLNTQCNTNRYASTAVLMWFLARSSSLACLSITACFFHFFFLSSRSSVSFTFRHSFHKLFVTFTSLPIKTSGGHIMRLRMMAKKSAREYSTEYIREKYI